MMRPDPTTFEVPATGHRYWVRPARPHEFNWHSHDTHECYVTIVRLADGKKLATAWTANWRDTDEWAAPRWAFWVREARRYGLSERAFLDGEVADD